MTKWALMFFALLFSFGAGFLVSRHHYSARDREVVAKINSIPVGRRELMRALTVYRLKALEQIVQNRAISEYARRKGITVSDSELDFGQQKFQDYEHQLQVAANLRSEALLRKIILSKWPTQQRGLLLEQFRPALTRYSVTVICLLNDTDLELLNENLARGATFSSMVSKFGAPLPINVAANGLIANATLAELKELIGGNAVDAIALLKPGETTKLVPSNFGKLVIHLDEKKDDEQTLRPYLDEVLIESQRNALLYKVAGNTVLESPYLEALRTTPKPTPNQDVGKLAAPSSNATSAPVNKLPSPKIAPSDNASPSTNLDLPKPDATPTSIPGLDLHPDLKSTPTQVPRPRRNLESTKTFPKKKVSTNTR